MSMQLLDAAVDMALAMTAQMFRLPKETVTTIVQVGVPLMARMAQTNPEICKRMYAASLAPLPEPVETFYVRMVESRAVRQAAMDDYRATYGLMLDAVNREAARQAGTTDGQARDILAATLPAISQALGQANAGGDARGFIRRLQDLHDSGGCGTASITLE